MRDYRIEMEDHGDPLVTYIKAANEYEAKEEARSMYPTYMLLSVVEVMPETDDV